MRLCAVPEAEGLIVGKSLYHANGKLLLGAGYRITSSMQARLKERNISHVYVMEDGTDDVIPEDVISDEIRMQSRTVLAGKVSELKRQNVFRNVSRNRAIELLNDGYMKHVNITVDLKVIVEEILKDISAMGNKFLNSVSIKADDTYFLDHAINVTVLSTLIGKKYRFTKPELISLALGSFLHDIGKVVIEQMQGDHTRNPANDLYREHPTFGYLLVRNNSDITPIVSQVINQHHEYQDGSGFPIGLSGENSPPVKPTGHDSKGRIYRLAEICCVANTFDNLSFVSHDGTITAPGDAIRQIILDSGTIYNRDIVQTLLQVVPIYPVGSTIKVVDIVDPHLIGYRGVVAKLNEKEINKPIIILTHNKFMKKIKPMIIDTSNFTNVDLHIVL